jgi:hypothetical protein
MMMVIGGSGCGHNGPAEIRSLSSPVQSRLACDTYHMLYSKPRFGKPISGEIQGCLRNLLDVSESSRDAALLCHVG